MKKSMVLLGLQLLIIPALMSQTADEIISKHIAARGGLEKIKSLQSLIMEGTMSQAGNDISMKFYLVNNKASKLEYTAVGKTGYSILTNTEGWTFNPFTGATAPTAIAADQVKASQVQLDLQSPLADYKAKGNKVTYEGKDTIEEAPAFRLVLTRSDGKTATYYIGSNYLVVRSITTAYMNGAEQEITTNFSDYRKTPEGYVFAFKRISPNGEINFSKIEVNPKIDLAIFKPGN